MRSIEAGAKATASEKCEVCGTKYTFTIKYWILGSLWKSIAKVRAHNMAVECAAKDLGY